MHCHRCKAKRIKSNTRIKTEHCLTHAFNSMTNGVLYLEPHPITEPQQRSQHIVFFDPLRRRPSSQSNKCVKSMPKRFAVKTKQRCYKTTRVHATAMQCAIATCISAVQTSSQSHQPCIVASRNALTALKSSWVMACRAPTVNPMDQVPEQGRLAPEGRVCNQKLMARQHAKRHGGHRTLPNVFLLH